MALILNVADRAELYGLIEGHDDIRALAAHLPEVIHAIDLGLQDYYRRLPQFFEPDATRQRQLIAEESAHLTILFAGRYDESYTASVERLVTFYAPSIVGVRSHATLLNLMTIAFRRKLLGFGLTRLAARSRMFDVVTRMVAFDSGSLSAVDARRTLGTERARTERVEHAIDIFSRAIDHIVGSIREASDLCTGASGNLQSRARREPPNARWTLRRPCRASRPA